MANDKTYDRHINIWINGKEVKNDVASIKKEMYQLINAQSRMTIGSKEYVAAGEEIKKLKGILGDHNTSLRQTQSTWSKVKDTAAGTMLKLTALGGVIFGAVKTIKSFASTTEGIGDRVTHMTAATKEMFWELQRSVATLDFSNLIKGLTEAWKRGKMLSEELDRLADEQAYSDYIVSSLSRESRRLEEITKNTFLEVNIRAEAARKREELEKKIYDRQVMIAKEAFEIEKKTWDGRNKLAAEEALKIYQTVEALDNKTRDKLQAAFDLGKTLQMGSIKKGIQSVLYRQSSIPELAGIDDQTLKTYAEYWRLMEAGESDVMPKLFNAFKKYENDIEAAQTRMNSFVRESAMIFRKEANTIDIKGDTSDLETAVAGAIMSPEYFPSDYAQIQTEMDAYLEHEKLVNEQRRKDYEETQAAIYESVVDSADDAIAEMERLKEEEMRFIQDRVNAYSQYGETIGSIMGDAMTNSTLTARDVAKELIRIAFQELQRRADLYIAELTIKNIALLGPLWGGIKSARQALLIKGLIAGAGRLASGLFYSGGYTGSGGKYQPAGIVHAGEWVANQDMVASPVTGPIIRALEGYRQNNMPGYANGGTVQDSGSIIRDGSGATIITLNKDLVSGITRLNTFLDRLESKGVRNYWSYKDIDNMRQGMTRLEDIEDDGA